MPSIAYHFTVCIRFQRCSQNCRLMLMQQPHGIPCVCNCAHALPHRPHGRGIIRAGMSHCRHNSDPFQQRNHFQHPRNFGRHGHITDTALRQLLVVFCQTYIPLPQKLLRHCSLVSRCQKRTFQMNSQKLRSPALPSPVQMVLSDTPLCLLFRIRQHRRQPGSCPVFRKKTACLLQIICGCTVHIDPRRSVCVNINKSRNHF